MVLFWIAVATAVSSTLTSAPYSLAQDSGSSTESIGGSRVIKKYKVTIANSWGGKVAFTLDGTALSLPSGQVGNYTVRRLNIVYDEDTAPGVQEKKYSLDDGGKYRFRNIKNRIVLLTD